MTADHAGDFTLFSTISVLCRAASDECTRILEAPLELPVGFTREVLFARAQEVARRRAVARQVIERLMVRIEQEFSAGEVVRVREHFAPLLAMMDAQSR